MTRCDYCGKSIDGVPFKCHRCTGHYCSEHHLPEDHNCPGLEKEKSKNQEKWKKAFVETFSGKKNLKSSNYKENKRDNLHRRKRSPFAKLKYFFIYKAKDFGDWLNNREHRKYNFGRRFNYLLGILIPLAISIVAYAIFYSNAQKLNDVNLWIIKLGGVLILVSVFFIIKYGIRFIKELINILKRQRNWLKYLIIILLIFLLWQAYTNKDTVLNPVFDIYNQTNFSLYMPIGGLNLSSSSSSGSSNLYSNQDKDNTGFGGFINGIIDPKSQIDISELEKRVHILVNEERINYGLKPLTWDDKLSLIAREHSQDMATNDFFSHDNLQGGDPTDRGNNHGYTCRKDYGSYYTYGLAENIALTPIYSDVVGCGSTTNLDSLAECIVDGWMTSPGHRENILTSTYTKEGIGIAYSNNDQAYSTQDFC